MASIAHMATYPPRAEALLRVLTCLHPQVDRIELVLNGYLDIPAALARFSRLSCHIPPADLKDTGKFHPAAAPDDDIFLCDDDLLYPADYTDRLKSTYLQYAALHPVVGVHGVLYPPAYDGAISSRRTVYLGGQWNSNTTVHQLGTGTILCKGWQLPPFDAMRNAQRHVDLIFARHAFAQGYPLVCIQRAKDWLTEIPDAHSIFHTFTKQWPPELVAMAKELSAKPLLDLRQVSAGC